MTKPRLVLTDGQPEAFLQSALLVDDRALLAGADAIQGESDQSAPSHQEEDDIGGNPYSTDVYVMDSEQPREEGETALPDLPKNAKTQQDTQDPSALPGDSEASLPDEIDARSIVNEFAERGIACATLAPQSPTGSDRERILKLAARTDIVVLDWSLGSRLTEDGDIEEGGISELEVTSRRLIAGLAQEDLQRGGRLRLICIYTGDSNLDDITTQVADALRSVYPVTEVQELDDRRTVVAPNLRAMVVAKPDNPSPDAIKVDGRSLPPLLIGEFKKFADGLLRRVALAGLGAVRDNAHRILLRFPSELDAAFLSHRALVGKADADEYAIRLIGDEIAATVLASCLGRMLENDLIEAEVDLRLPISAADRRMRSTSKGQSLTIVDTAAARKLFLEGREASGLSNEDMGGAELEQAASVTTLLLEGESDSVLNTADQLDRALAVVSCLARDPRFDGAGQPAPLLTLGAILRDESNKQHFLCVQPLCDSVRLGRPTAFPLLPLEAVGGEVAYDISVPHPEKQAVTLRLSSLNGKLRKLALVKFEPHPSEAIVRAEQDPVSPAWFFRSVGAESSPSRRYRWLGELRADQAARCALALGQSAARVGVFEAEYQRVWAKRQ